MKTLNKISKTIQSAIFVLRNKFSNSNLNSSVEDVVESNESEGILFEINKKEDEFLFI